MSQCPMPRVYINPELNAKFLDHFANNHVNRIIH